MSIGQSILECCLSKPQSLHQYQGHSILAKIKKIILFLGVTACKNWIWCTAQGTLLYKTPGMEQNTCELSFINDIVRAMSYGGVDTYSILYDQLRG